MDNQERRGFFARLRNGFRNLFSRRNKIYIAQEEPTAPQQVEIDEVAREQNLKEYIKEFLATIEEFNDKREKLPEGVFRLSTDSNIIKSSDYKNATEIIADVNSKYDKQRNKGDYLIALAALIKHNATKSLIIPKETQESIFRTLKAKDDLLRQNLNTESLNKIPKKELLDDIIKCFLSALDENSEHTKMSYDALSVVAGSVLFNKIKSENENSNLTPAEAVAAAREFSDKTNILANDILQASAEKTNNKQEKLPSPSPASDNGNVGVQQKKQIWTLDI